MNMEGKSPERRQRKDLSSSRGRFDSMSWLYRDGLSYQPLARPRTAKLPARSAAEQPSAKPSASAPIKETPVIKPIEQSRGDRFKSMSWLYRDGLQGANTEQKAPKQATPAYTVTEKSIQSERPIVSDMTIPPTRIEKSVTNSKTTSAKEDAKYEAMRWLYEDEASFQKAIKELKAEEAAERLKKEQAKQARKERLHKAYITLQVQTKRVVQYARAEPKRAVLGGGIAAVVIVVIVFGTIGMTRDSGAKVAGDAVVNQSDPEYDPLLPNSDSSQTDSKIAYDEQRKVANYTDSIDSTKVTISQQPLPERFTVNQAVELEKFAKEINANQLIQVGDTKAYAGLSVQGPQTVVLIKNDLLVFMKADKEISTGAWMAYIESLD